MEAACSSETSVDFRRTKQRYNPEYSPPHSKPRLQSSATGSCPYWSESGKYNPNTLILTSRLRFGFKGDLLV
jgi:hypothetical protein